MVLSFLFGLSLGSYAFSWKAYERIQDSLTAISVDVAELKVKIKECE